MRQGYGVIFAAVVLTMQGAFAAVVSDSRDQQMTIQSRPLGQVSGYNMRYEIGQLGEACRDEVKREIMKLGNQGCQATNKPMCKPVYGSRLFNADLYFTAQIHFRCDGQIRKLDSNSCTVLLQGGNSFEDQLEKYRNGDGPMPRGLLY